MSGNGSFGLPLHFEEASHLPNCVLTTWTVKEPQALAHALARLYLRTERHAARVTEALEPGRAALLGRTVESLAEHFLIGDTHLGRKLPGKLVAQAKSGI